MQPSPGILTFRSSNSVQWTYLLLTIVGCWSSLMIVQWPSSSSVLCATVVKVSNGSQLTTINSTTAYKQPSVTPPFTSSINNVSTYVNIASLPVHPFPNWTAMCPCRLCAESTNETSLASEETQSYRKIICDAGNLTTIPIYSIPFHVEWIEIDADPKTGRLNNLTLGPVFYRFGELRVLRVRHSQVPAIGPATFRYRIQLVELDLSHNLIENFHDANFKGLKQLAVLNLSHNRLSDLTSAPFRHLHNLRHLNLSHNGIQTITTRLFYNLTKLESLDLSSNPINEIPPQNTIDLRPLKRLYMSRCELKELHSLFYRNVPHLQVLDLRYNRIEQLHKYEYRHLPNLTELYLDGNRLIVIPSIAFFGLNLQHLGLSYNFLVRLHSDSFNNATITELSLSGNNFTHFDAETFRPLANCLRKLDLTNCHSLTKPTSTVAQLLSPLTTLEWINLSNLTLDSSSLSSSIFMNSRASIRFLNLSHNHLTNMSANLMSDMNKLEMIDLSHNNLYELSSEFLYTLSTFVNLSFAFFDHNPWSCYRCHLLYFRNWITSTERSPNAYQNACQLKERCAQCQFPPNLEGYMVHQMEEWQLEWCTDPTVQLRVSTTEPNVGLVLALLIIIILIIVIVGVIVYYRNRGAIYFTNEDILYGRSSTVGGGTDGGGERDQDTDKGSSVYNISTRIRHFAQATASPPESDGGISSADSLVHNGEHKLSKQAINGLRPSRQPIDQPLMGAISQLHQDSSSGSGLRARLSTESGTTSSLIKSKQANQDVLIGRYRQASTASSTATVSSKGFRGFRTSSDDDPNESHSGNGRKLTKPLPPSMLPPTSRYRILQSHKSSSNITDEEEEEEQVKEQNKQPYKGKEFGNGNKNTGDTTKPPLPKKKIGAHVTLADSKKRNKSTISISSSDSSASSKTQSYSDLGEQSHSSHNSSVSSAASGSGEHDVLPSALRPYHPGGRSSAEAQEADNSENHSHSSNDDDEEEDDNEATDEQSRTSSQSQNRETIISKQSKNGNESNGNNKSQVRSGEEDGGGDGGGGGSSRDSSTAALADGGSTSPSSARSSDFGDRSPVHD